MHAERPAEVVRLLGAVRAWATGRADVRGVALVGSFARGEAHEGSDVDLVVLTDDPARFADHQDWAAALGATGVVRTQGWGVLLECRLCLPSGREVDVGFAAPDWAATAPVHAGTDRVVRDGFEAVHDPHGLLEALGRAVPADR